MFKCLKKCKECEKLKEENIILKRKMRKLEKIVQNILKIQQHTIEFIEKQSN